MAGLDKIEGDEHEAAAFASSRLYDDDRIPYLPNLPQGTVGGQKEVPPLSKDMILDPAEEFPLSRVTVVTYIHVVRMEGYIRPYRPDDPFSRHFEGYRTTRIFGDEQGLRHGHSHVGEGGSFIVIWGKRRRRYLTYKKPYDLRLILRPQFRQDVWASLDWMMGVAQMIQDEYADPGEPMRIRYIEVATDFGGDFRRQGIRQCHMRGWAKKAYRHDDSQTQYDAWQEAGRSSTIYEKEGMLHQEDRWRDKTLLIRGKKKQTRALLSRHTVFLSLAVILRLLLEKYRFTSFRYLDLRLLADAPTARQYGVLYWRRFLGWGLRAALEMMQGHDPTGVVRHAVSQPRRKVSLHPIDAVFRQSLTAAIAEGISRLAAADASFSDLSPGSVAEGLGDRDSMRDLYRRVVERVEGEYRRRTGRRPRRRHHGSRGG